VSSRAQSTDGAIRTTYALVLAMCVLTLAPHTLLRGESGWAAEFASWFRCLSPIPAVMEIMGQGDVGAHGFSESASAIPRYLLLASITSPGTSVWDIQTAASASQTALT